MHRADDPSAACPRAAHVRRTEGSWGRRASAVVAFVCAGLIVPHPSYADSPPRASFAQMGIGSPLTISAGVAQQLTIPDDPGLRAAVMTGRLALDDDALTDGLRGAQVVFSSGGRVIGRVRLTRTGTAKGMRLALPSPAAGAGETTVSVRVVPEYLSTTCPDPFVSSVTLTDGHVTFAGHGRPPSTISDAFPSVLQRLDLVLPSYPTRAQVQSAARIATQITAPHGGRPVEVHVTERRPAASLPHAPYRPFERTVVIARGDPGVALVTPARHAAPVVVVSGDDAQLERQTALLTASLRALVDTGRAHATTIAAPVEIPREISYFSDLELPSLVAVGRRVASIELPFSQSALGGQLSSLSVRLRGTVGEFAVGVRARLVVLLDGRILSSTPARTGAFDHTLVLPAAQLRNFATLEVRIETAVNAGGCGRGSTDAVHIELDPSSFFDARFGSGGIEGFDELPQALLPATNLALSSYDTSTVTSAIQFAALLQQLGRRPLNVTVTTVHQALASTRAALLVGPGLLSLRGLPFGVSGATVTVGASRLRIRNYKVAALEAFRGRGTHIVVASWHGRRALLGRLLRTLAGRATGLQSLGTGQVAVASETGVPRTLDVRHAQRAAVHALAVPPQGLAEPDGDGMTQWVLLAAAATFLLGIAVLVAARRR